MIPGTFAPVLLLCCKVLVAKLVIVSKTYMKVRGIDSADFVHRVGIWVSFWIR